MLETPQILLAQDDSGFSRIIGILVIIGIFVLGNVLQWIQKYQEQKRKQEQQRRAQASASPAQQPIAGRPSPRPGLRPRQTVQPRRPASAQRATPLPAPASGQRRPQPALPPLPRGSQAPVRRPAPPQPAAAPAVEVETRVTQHRHAAGKDITASEIGAAGAVGQQESADKRTEFLRAVLNRHSLRNAYILTEILQPPLALRDSTTPEP